MQNFLKLLAIIFLIVIIVTVAMAMAVISPSKISGQTSEVKVEVPVEMKTCAVDSDCTAILSSINYCGIVILNKNYTKQYMDLYNQHNKPLFRAGSCSLPAVNMPLAPTKCINSQCIRAQ